MSFKIFMNTITKETKSNNLFYKKIEFVSSTMYYNTFHILDILYMYFSTLYTFIHFYNL